MLFKKSRVAQLVFVVLIIAVGAIIIARPDFSHSSGTTGYFTKGIQSLYGLNGPAFLAPGYSVLLMLLDASVGISTDTLRAVQILLLITLVLGVYELGKILFDNQSIGYVAGILLATYFSAIAMIFSQSPDLLYAVLVLFSVLFGFRLITTGKYRYAVFAGAGFAAAALTDPIGLYVPLIFFVVIIFALRVGMFRATRWFKSAVILLLFLATFAVGVAPWAYRNILVFGAEDAPVVQKNFEIEVFTGALPGPAKLESFEYQKTLVLGAVQMFLIPYNLDHLDGASGISYKQVIKNILMGVRAPASVLFLLVLKIILFISHALLLLLAALGVWRVLFKSALPQIQALFVGGCIAYIVLASVLYGGSVRFTNLSPLNGFFFVYMPFLLIFAASEIVHVVERVKSLFLKSNTHTMKS